MGGLEKFGRKHYSNSYRIAFVSPNGKMNEFISLEQLDVDKNVNRIGVFGIIMKKIQGFFYLTTYEYHTRLPAFSETD